MKQRIHRNGLRTAALAAALVSALAACGSGSDGASGGSTLRTLQSLSPSQFDPCGPANGSETAYMAAIYAPLVRTDPGTGKLSSGIATSWNFSGDLKTLTMKLRTGLKFQDGTALDGAAVKKSIEQCLALGNQQIPGLKSIDVQGADTIVFNLSEPGGGLPEMLGSRIGMIASPAAREKSGDKYGASPVGAGPYRLSGFVPGSSVTLQKWAGYQAAGLPAAKVERITSQVITDPSAQVAALTGGQADFAWRLDNSAPKALQGTDVHTEHNLGVSITNLSVDRSQGPLADKRVRQAISYAIDRSALTKASTSGMSDVGSLQPYPPGNPLHFDDLDGTYPYDPAKARQLLAEAGHPGGLTLRGAALNSPSFVNNGVIISDQLAKVGIKVKFEAKDIGDATKGFYVEHKYDLLSSGMNSGPDWLSIYRRLLTTKSSGNAGHVPVPGGEEAVAKANAAKGDAELKAALKSADQVLQSELPIIPLYYSPTVTAWTGRVTGGAASIGLNGEADLTALGLK
ncbi:ABC transporter substrate-binding protein [Actinomadura nitritigenes]|uniref:ABC transporter substrate-binding protein n=1 Tax=Actinomadura nitritigenes TaxID=134602 RepID=UPI003D8AB2CC